MKKFLYLSVTAGLFCLLTACSETSSDTAQPPAAAIATIEAAADTQQSPADEAEPDNPQVNTTETEAARPEAESPKTDTVTYSYEDIYLSVTLPKTWEYQVKTKEEMEGEDSMLFCAIDFWPANFPDAVFHLGYQTQKLGICATGVTIEEFSLPNGLTGYRYTESIEDTLWLTIAFDREEEPAGQEHSGNYLISASPALSEWEQIAPDFEQILSSVQVGTAFSAP